MRIIQITATAITPRAADIPAKYTQNKSKLTEARYSGLMSKLTHGPVLPRTKNRTRSACSSVAAAANRRAGLSASCLPITNHLTEAAMQAISPNISANSNTSTHQADCRSAPSKKAIRTVRYVRMPAPRKMIPEKMRCLFEAIFSSFSVPADIGVSPTAQPGRCLRRRVFPPPPKKPWRCPRGSSLQGRRGQRRS